MVTAKVGIPEGHLEILMPQELFNGQQINPIHDQLRSKGMPKVMKTKPSNTGLL
jgi:hypothetical protein